MNNEQTQANNMTGCVNWWRQVLQMLADQGVEYAAPDGDIYHASKIMGRMIDKIEALADPDGQFYTELYFEHADGRAVRFELRAVLCDPDGTFDEPE